MTSKPFGQSGDIGPAVGFNQPDDYIDPIILKSMAFLEHLIGFPHPRTIAQIDLQPAALGVADHSQKSVGSVATHRGF